MTQKDDAPVTEAKGSEAGASIDIVFDGPPSAESGRFVEVESPPGTSIKFGEWIHREDGYWVLRIDNPDALRARRAFLEARVADLDLMLRVAGEPSMFCSLRRKQKGPRHKPWHVWELTAKTPDDGDGEATLFKLTEDEHGVPVLTDPARAALEEEDGG